MPGLTGYELLTINLRRLTELGSLSLPAVADRAGIDRRELFAAMAGEFDPGLDWLNSLAEALGVPLAELFVEEQPGKPPAV